MRRLLYILLLFPLITQAQSIHITTTTDTVCNGLPAYFRAADTGVSTAYYQWTVNGMAIAGADSATFSNSSLSNGDRIACLLANSMHIVIAYSNNIIMTVLSVPSAGTITGVDSNVCMRATITLYDAVTGGVWSAYNDHATVAGGIVTGVSGQIVDDDGDQGPAKDSIFYIVSNLCGSDSAFKIITVEPLPPDASFYLEGSLYVTSGVGVCVGQYLTISDIDGDGPPDGTMYATNNNASVSWNGVVGNSPGTDYIFCVTSNVCGSDTFGWNVTVYPRPAIAYFTASATNICVGSKISLFDSATGSLHWSFNNESAVIDSTGEVIGLLAGLNNIYLTAENNCGDTTASIKIKIDEPEPITGIDSFCIGESIQFVESTSGGLWSSSNNVIVTVNQDGIAKGLSEGSVVISYSLPSSGCTVTWETKVRPDYLPTPITGDAAFCFNGVTYLSEATSGGQWASSDLSVASVDTTGMVAGMGDGDAIITYTFNGCLQTIDVSVAECGNGMKIYPNPAHAEVTIYAFDSIYNAYTFYNAVGQKVMWGTLAGPFTTVHVELLAAGFYTIVITGEQDKYVGKFVKD